MSLFKTTDDNSDAWKERYFQLLDSQEQFEKLHQANEELLCKTVVRFALAVKGFSKFLDPHLDRIRNALKTGLESRQLKQELEVFSNALMLMDDDADTRHLDASLLFDFLAVHYPDRSDELQVLQQRHRNQEFSNTQRLFLTLAETIEEKPQAAHVFDVGLAEVDCKAIRQHMIHLLDSADLPEGFVEDSKQLKSRLENGQALGAVFEDAVTLLLAIKSHLQVEQQEMATFLATLTEELAEIGLRASGVNVAHEDALTKRVSLNLDVAAQMDDLQRTSATATALDPLKQLVSVRLRKISQQMQAHNLQEQLERDKSQSELKGLVQKIREMESETVDLRSRLELAQQRATRDPLTHLPNRLAFEAVSYTHLTLPTIYSV